MSSREVLLLALVVMCGVFLVVSGRLSLTANPPAETPLLSPATDITDLPKTRHLTDVTNRVINIRTQELSEAYDLDPKDVVIKTKGEALQAKFDEHYTVTFELDIKGVRGLYAERYTVRTTKKRMFQITNVQYDQKCTMGNVIQEWTIEPCAVEMGG